MAEVSIVRGLVDQRLVGAPRVVEVKILCQSSSRLRSGLVGMQVNIFAGGSDSFADALSRQSLHWQMLSSPDAVGSPDLRMQANVLLYVSACAASGAGLR